MKLSIDLVVLFIFIALALSWSCDVDLHAAGYTVGCQPRETEEPSCDR